MNTDFYRIKRLPPYIFEEVNRLKAQSRAKGPPRRLRKPV